MTTLQKIQWKIPIKNPNVIDAWDFFRAFSAWIPESPEIFVDVVDYRHVHDGPKIALIGHYADFFLDDSDGELGLVSSQKRSRGGDLDEILTLTLTTLKNAVDRLVRDPLFGGKLEFSRERLLFVANDRAIAPNTAKTFEHISAPITKALQASFPARPAFLRQASKNPAERFGIRVRFD